MEDLTKKTNEELEAIIRRVENTNISGSLFQRAKIELDIRDRKPKNDINFIETMRINDSLEKKIKRGKESWNFFWIIFSVILAVAIFIISILPLSWIVKILILAVVLATLAYFCFLSVWWQNKLIGLKNFLENSWKKL